MASVGSGASGKVLIGNGNGQGPTYASIGLNSALTAHGVVIAQGNGAFVATAVGTAGQFLMSNGAGVDPTFQTISSIGTTQYNVLTGGAAGSINNVPPSSTVGNPLVSSGSSAQPTFSATPIVTSLTISGTPSSGSDATNITFSNATYLKIASNLSDLNSVATARTSLGLTAVATQTVSNHNVLLGAASNAITSLAPSSTSGVPLVSQGASSDPAFGTAVIAGGGTNATSMSTSTGIVKYDGTRLVTSTTAKIDSSNRMTNTSQPVVFAQIATTVTNATGDGTLVDVIFDSTTINVGTSYSTSTGVFTAPVTGNYFFSTQVSLSNVTVLVTVGQINFSTSAGQNIIHEYSPGKSFEVVGNLAPGVNTAIFALTAAQTVKVQAYAAGTTKTVGIQGNNFGIYSYLSIFLIC